MSVPGADELFRRTGVPSQPTGHDDDQDAPAEPVRPLVPSGRVRHDEKMTVYVTADELLELERARLALRQSGVSIDRGRLVREAIALALADLAANGDDSALVRRLTQA